MNRSSRENHRASPSFTGFPPQALAFLRELAQNNDKAWFDAHKGQYEQYVKEPTRLFGEAMAERLKSVAAGPELQASPFRIYRDVRFSRDKRPYKTYVGVPFGNPAHKKGESPGFYFQLDAERVMLAAGLHLFDKPLLEAYREAVAGESLGPRLAEIVGDLSGQGYEVWGQTYKRVPRGYDPQAPRADLLRYSGLAAGVYLPHPPELHHPELIDFCFEHYAALAPVQHWLVQVAGG